MATTKNAPPRLDARELIAGICAREGITLVEFSARSGISRSTPFSWFAGKPSTRDRVARLARLWNEPRLLDAIRSRPNVYRLTCIDPKHRGAVRVQKFDARNYRAMLKRGHNPEARINPDTGIGTHVCQACKARAAAPQTSLGRTMINRKNRGDGSARRHGQRVHALIKDPVAKGDKLKNRQERDKAIAEGKPLRSLERAHARTDGVPQTLEVRWNHAIVEIRPRTKSRYDYCRGLVKRKGVMKPHGVIIEVRPYNGRPGALCGACQNNHRRGPRKGEPLALAAPARPRGKRLTSSQLTETIEIAIRVFLRGETIGEMAHEFDREPRTIRARLRELIGALPRYAGDDDPVAFWDAAIQAGRRPQGLRLRSLALRWGWQKRPTGDFGMNTPENRRKPGA